MKKYNLRIFCNNSMFKIDKRLFGSFIEHMGSVVYNGIFEKDHPLSNNNGFRMDVLELIKDLNLGVIRYPGGNFTSGYDWKDTIGPKEKRPTKLELAWQGIETNEFGLNEFLDWIKLVDSEPIVTINLGTKGIQDAANIVEYCNFSSGTYWSDLRKSHGYSKPHNIKLWCLGNELDGKWQIGTMTANEYGVLAREASKVMKRVDNSIETIVVGSSTPRLDSFPEWDREVLMETYDYVDYIAIHNYIDKYENESLNDTKSKIPSDTASYLSRYKNLEFQINTIINVCDYVKAKKRSSKRMKICFDEWNVHREPEETYEKWQIGSPIDKCHFTMEDSLLFGSMGLTILKNAERVKISCQSLLVNTIPLILTEKNGKSWVNPTYYIMKDLCNFAKGEVIEFKSDIDNFDSALYKDVPKINVVVTKNDEEVVIFANNIFEEDAELLIDLENIHQIEGEMISLFHESLYSTNKINTPYEIVPIKKKINDMNSVFIKKYSWNVIKIKIKHN